jgi:hypothetical protein
MGRSLSSLSPLNDRLQVVRRRTARRDQIKRGPKSSSRIVPIRAVSAKSHRNRGKALSSQEALPGVKEQEWLRDHWREYVGLWVAVEGDKLVGKASNAREAMEKAISSGHSSAFLVRVTEPSEFPFGGW